MSRLVLLDGMDTQTVVVHSTRAAASEDRQSFPAMTSASFYPLHTLEGDLAYDRDGD